MLIFQYYMQLMQRFLERFSKIKPKYRVLVLLLSLFVIGTLLGGSAVIAQRVSNSNQSAQEDSKSSTELASTPESDEQDDSTQSGQVSGASETVQPVDSTPKPEPTPAVTPSQPQAGSQNTSPSPATSKYRQFTGQQFVDFYNSFVYSNVTSITVKPTITGDPAADARIQNLAETRGYRLRGESLNGGYQPQLNTAITNLRTAAAQEAGLNFVTVSGYRSINDQRGIFLAAMDQVGVNRSLIASGSQDGLIESVLVTRSIPGYSKHHTGYTVDFGCNSQDLLGFINTACYEWISANNYENAKRFGLIPSYPDGAINQGPNPEQWEYVWVGEAALKN
jgi:LAS superfamily LD-carboxypeptidase LdcB